MTSSDREIRLSADELPAPGEVKLVRIRQHRIGVMRVGDEFHALADRCPHRGAPVSSSGVVVTGVERLPDGTLQLGEEGALIRCPWHKWDFDIATGRCTADARMRIRRYAVRLDGDALVVSLESAAAQDRARP